MKYFVAFAAVIAVCTAHVEWHDFRAGDLRLPTTSEAAESQGWVIVNGDEDLGVQWWGREQDLNITLAYDGRRNVAGVRVSIFEDDINKQLKALYKNSEFFETGVIYGRTYYYSTLLLTDEAVLRTGGRMKLPTDEVALSPKVKRSGRYEDILSDGCEQFLLANHEGATLYEEQGCEQEYGLVVAAVGPGRGCDTLTPFYLVYDPRTTGQLVGVGWLSVTTPRTRSPYHHTLSQFSLRKRFPHAPSCMWALPPGAVSALDLWLSRQDSRRVSCPCQDSWVADRCITEVPKST